MFGFAYVYLFIPEVKGLELEEVSWSPNVQDAMDIKRFRLTSCTAPTSNRGAPQDGSLLSNRHQTYKSIVMELMCTIIVAWSAMMIVPRSDGWISIKHFECWIFIVISKLNNTSCFFLLLYSLFRTGWSWWAWRFLHFLNFIDLPFFGPPTFLHLSVLLFFRNHPE